ncbi:MAG: hydroxymethylbilane synthase [Rubrivivax sp.]|nr:hydroxymethylbilane synthase [Rubrivivax sp.]
MSAPSRLVIATRESRLALWQAEHVRAVLGQRFGLAVELLGMTTRGDQILDRTLSKVGGKGLFVKELETALEEGRAQLAVHSLKDVPMELPAGFVLAAVWEREDPRDAFVSNRCATLHELPRGARVGTSSLRRQAQLLALRPDLDIQPLRGNLDTRLRKLDEGGYDAIVLAAAGLVRLGLAERIRSRFDVQQMIPAAGQGALGLEVREQAAEWRALLAQTSHRPTELAALAERAVSRALGGSCTMPLAAHARWVDGRLHLAAALGHATEATRPLLRTAADAAVADAAAAQALGESAAARLQAAGAGDYLAAAAAAATAAG